MERVAEFGQDVKKRIQTKIDTKRGEFQSKLFTPGKEIPKTQPSIFREKLRRCNAMTEGDLSWWERDQQETVAYDKFIHEGESLLEDVPVWISTYKTPELFNEEYIPNDEEEEAEDSEEMELEDSIDIESHNFFPQYQLNDRLTEIFEKTHDDVQNSLARLMEKNPFMKYYHEIAPGDVEELSLQLLEKGNALMETLADTCRFYEAIRGHLPLPDKETFAVLDKEREGLELIYQIKKNKEIQPNLHCNEEL